MESVTAEKIADTVNAVNTEDAVKYLPNLLVRKRHIGDTQAPITTRTSGVGSSARSLIYADGVLLSALIGNNNSNASPRWGMVAPGEIAGIDVMYGPFAAAYAGNSIGAVVEITTHMPEHLEGYISTQGTLQTFKQYRTKDDYGAYQVSAGLGDRIGKFSYRLAYNHLDSNSQPLAFVTATRPASPGIGGAAVTGAVSALNRTGAPIAVLGAGGFEHQLQDNITAKFALDLTPSLRATYTLGIFAHDDDADAETYLRDAAGQPVYGGSLRIDGYTYAVAPSAFASNVYNLKQTHVMQALALRSSTQGTFDFDVVASLYTYLNDIQRTPSTLLPGARSGGAGSIVDMDGTGWATFDAKGIWRPGGLDGAHQASFGAHWDRYELASARFLTSDWIAGGRGSLAAASSGKTETYALWAQDAWRILRDVTLTLGGRYEQWRAYSGLNFSLSPGLSVAQPQLSSSAFSPKAAIAWRFAPGWRATGSFGVAYRFPTVTELYQAITTGSTLSVPNPNLKPERALSGEISLERSFADGKIRLSLFEESLSDALISQSAPLVAGSATLFNFVQNIDKVESRGIELVAEKDNVLLDGLTLSGSVTFVDSTIVKDNAFHAAEGRQTPQIPSWRATLVASYKPDDHWTFTAAARYSNRVYGTIDNSDIYTHTYQGFESYFVVDLRTRYEFNKNWSAAVGIDNVNNADYFLFHPFPQRTVSAELKYNF